jgi:non-specific serine/threonine protein kinase
LLAAGFEDAVEIGRGGFGVVYRCRQVGLDRVVAVKVLTADLHEHRARFAREQRAMGRLTGHPNIVAVLQVGETSNGQPFLVMPYHAQGCLTDRIRESGVLPLEEVLRVGVKIAGALACAHRVGIVHRDIKPGNILLTDYGEPALSDFGIAHIEDGYRTESGAFVGSPAFSAPEVLGGDVPGEASDTYGLGATLCCALTGHAPFERREGEPVVAQLLRIAADPLPDLREWGIAPDVAALIEEAMARDPGKRPTAVELGKQLQALQADCRLIVDDMALLDISRFDRRDEWSASMPRRANTTGDRLPASVTNFVGRQAELAQLRQMLSASRLVTLAGIGGVGKTSLAIHAARELRGSYADGVWLVELADLRDDALLTGVIAAALGLRDQPGQLLDQVVVGFLKDRDALLIIDNCEQLIDSVASAVQALLVECPRLRVVATSREVLDINGESVMMLDPLSYPDDDSDPTLSWVSSYPAVALFVERARGAVPSFALTPDNAAAVRQICARAEGLPLAIELVAAGMRYLSADQIATGLADQFAELTGSRRGRPTRQRTLASCIKWSFDLCTSAEQQLWTRLSVFAGSFGLRAAQDVCGDGVPVDDFLGGLWRLVDKSILIRRERDGEVRYRMLESLRDYGGDHLSDEERSTVRRRHFNWHLLLLADARTEWFGPKQVWWIHRLTDKIPNLREALQYGLTDCPDLTLDMASDLSMICNVHGALGEALRWLDLGLEATPAEPTTSRIRALYLAVVISCMRVELSAAKTWVIEARQHVAVVDDPEADARVEFSDGYVAMLSGDIPRARICLESAAASAHDPEVQASAMLVLGWLLEMSGDPGQALHWHEKMLVLSESRDESLFRSSALLCVAFHRWRQGEAKDAQRLLLQGLQLSGQVKNLLTGTGCIEGLACIAASEHDPRRATVLMAAAAGLSRSTGAPLFPFPHLLPIHDECERRAREELSQEDFDEAWQEGTSLTFGDVVDLVIEQSVDDAY